jgi:hypothetical protein
MQLRSRRLRILVVALIAIAVCTALILGLRKSDVPSGATSAISAGPSPSEGATSRVANLQEHTLNPAAQSPGPPDPEAMRSAARSAENAARAAAELAAK